MYIIKNKFIFLSVSGFLVLASIFSIFYFGFRQGIDFAGGTLWQFSAIGESAATIEPVFTTDFGVVDARISYDSTSQDFLVRTGEISELDHQKFLSVLKNKFPAFQESSFQSIGPSVGKELKTKAVFGVVFVLLAISIYVSLAFLKVSYPIKSWKYGVVALLCLFHDVVIPAGVLAWLGNRYKFCGGATRDSGIFRARYDCGF